MTNKSLSKFEIHTTVTVQHSIAVSINKTVKFITFDYSISNIITIIIKVIFIIVIFILGKETDNHNNSY